MPSRCTADWLNQSPARRASSNAPAGNPLQRIDQHQQLLALPSVQFAGPMVIDHLHQRRVVDATSDQWHCRHQGRTLATAGGRSSLSKRLCAGRRASRPTGGREAPGSLSAVCAPRFDLPRESSTVEPDAQSEGVELAGSASPFRPCGKTRFSARGGQRLDPDRRDRPAPPPHHRHGVR
jgi:hypothetical protein